MKLTVSCLFPPAQKFFVPVVSALKPAAGRKAKSTGNERGRNSKRGAQKSCRVRAGLRRTILETEAA